MVAIRGKSLGNLRYVMKDTLQLIPLYGLYFYQHGCIYVKRGQFNQEKMIKALEYLRSDKIYVSTFFKNYFKLTLTVVFLKSWMIVFPEGTRYYPGTPKVIEKSEQYAKDNKLQVKYYC